MLNKKIGIVLITGLIAVGVGVASAFAHNTSGSDKATVTAGITVTTSDDNEGVDEERAEQQNDQADVDEQGAANEVADAADEVEIEANNTAADDVNGDQQGPNDDSEEQGDDGQTD